MPYSSLTLVFGSDGQVNVRAYSQGQSFSVDCKPELIPAMVPRVILDELLDRIEAFVEVVEPSTLKRIGGK